MTNSGPAARRASARRMLEQLDQLAGLAPLLGRVAADDGALDAVVEVAFQQLTLDPRQRGAHGSELGHHVDAVALVLHHARDPAHLALDALQPVQQTGLGLGIHGGSSSGACLYHARVYVNTLPGYGVAVCPIWSKR